jgi:hypothetical protein
VPAYRDDRDALLERADALTRENQRLERENEELRAKATEPAPPAQVQMIEVPAGESPATRGNGWLIGGAIAAASAWLILAVGAATVVFYLAALLTTALVVGTVWERWRERRAVKAARQRRLPGAMSIDKRAYQELLETKRKTVNVLLDVTFAVNLAPTQRAQVEQSLAAAGLAARWDRETLQVRSRRLRIAKKGGGEVVRDPSPITEWCETAFAALGRVHEEWPIALVRPRATSGRR